MPISRPRGTAPLGSLRVPALVFLLCCPAVALSGTQRERDDLLKLCMHLEKTQKLINTLKASKSQPMSEAKGRAILQEKGDQLLKQIVENGKAHDLALEKTQRRIAMNQRFADTEGQRAFAKKMQLDLENLTSWRDLNGLALRLLVRMQLLDDRALERLPKDSVPGPVGMLEVAGSQVAPQETASSAGASSLAASAATSAAGPSASSPGRKQERAMAQLLQKANKSLDQRDSRMDQEARRSRSEEQQNTRAALEETERAKAEAEQTELIARREAKRSQVQAELEAARIRRLAEQQAQRGRDLTPEEQQEQDKEQSARVALRLQTEREEEQQADQAQAEQRQRKAALRELKARTEAEAAQAARAAEAETAASPSPAAAEDLHPPLDRTRIDPDLKRVHGPEATAIEDALIGLQQNGRNLAGPSSRLLEQGVWELRPMGGQTDWRILFGFVGDQAILIKLTDHGRLQRDLHEAAEELAQLKAAAKTGPRVR